MSPNSNTQKPPSSQNQKKPSSQSPQSPKSPKWPLTRLGFTILLLLFGAFYYYNSPSAQSSEDPSFREGQYIFGDIAANFNKMEADEVIESASFARLLAVLLGYDTRIQKGVYRFTNRLSTLEILKLLIRGEEESVLFTLVEGYDIYDIDEALSKKQLIATPGDFIKYSHSQTVLKNILETLALQKDIPKLTSSEGFLYPDTYRIRLSRAKEDLTQLSLAQFQTLLVPLLTEKSIPPEKWLSFMTISSLIEKETFHTSEKKLVASVVYNRIKASMRLRYDSSIIYALKKADRYKENLTDEGVIDIKREHFTFRSPYNTYAIKGLPKTPISSFTVSSLEAALNPAQTDYLFFVLRTRTDQPLTHDFSATYEEHLKKIETYQR